MKNRHKIKALQKIEVMDKKIECLCCHEVEAVKYFELLGMRYGDVNAIIQRV